MDKKIMEMDLNDIKKITSITVKKVCSELGINEKNMYNLRTSTKNVRLVKMNLIKELERVIGEIKNE